MEASPLAKDILKSIKWIKDTRLNTYLDLNNLSIQCDDIKSNIHHFTYNNTVIRRKNKLLMSFYCTNCKRENILALNNVVSKIERNKRTCNSCSVCLLQDFRSIEQKHDNNNTSLLYNKINSDHSDFMNLDENFKKNYFDKFMDTHKFNLLKHQIKSFQNNKYVMNEDIEYIPFFRSDPNFKSFQPMFYDKKRDTIELPCNIFIECFYCGCCFFQKTFFHYRKKPYILCKRCEMEFDSTKHKYINVYGNDVCYKTQFQCKFLKMCIKNEVNCINGPDKISFQHPNGSMKVTNIHFLLPDKKTAIDVVGNLEFQKDINPRLQSVVDYCKNNKIEYIQLYPKNYMKKIKYILKNK